MENIINLEQYKSRSTRKIERLNLDHDSNNAEVIFFTGVRIEYEKNKTVPGGPPKPVRRTQGDV